MKDRCYHLALIVGLIVLTLLLWPGERGATTSKAGGTAATAKLPLPPAPRLALFANNPALSAAHVAAAAKQLCGTENPSALRCTHFQSCPCAAVLLNHAAVRTAARVHFPFILWVARYNPYIPKKAAWRARINGGHNIAAWQPELGGTRSGHNPHLLLFVCANAANITGKGRARRADDWRLLNHSAAAITRELRRTPVAFVSETRLREQVGVGVHAASLSTGAVAGLFFLLRQPRLQLFPVGFSRFVSQASGEYRKADDPHDYGSEWRLLSKVGGLRVNSSLNSESARRRP